MRNLMAAAACDATRVMLPSLITDYILTQFHICVEIYSVTAGSPRIYT